MTNYGGQEMTMLVTETWATVTEIVNLHIQPSQWKHCVDLVQGLIKIKIITLTFWPITLI